MNFKKNEMEISFKKESRYLKTLNHFTKILITTMFLALLSMIVIAGCGGDSNSSQVKKSNGAASNDGLSTFNGDAQYIVTLGATQDYVVLAGSTITNIGATIITGDLGLSPGSSVTGFPPGIVVGTKHISDPSAVQAKLALTSAFNNAAGRTLAPVSLSGNIGGMTLAPGLYNSTSGLAISSGNLILDAKGNSNAIWIFQTASTLTASPGHKVILSGGAKAANIFWQVGTSATLGTSSVFKGTIMADQSITMNTGASLEGRVLARIGGVTLNGNTIVKPAL